MTNLYTDNSCKVRTKENRFIQYDIKVGELPG